MNLAVWPFETLAEILHLNLDLQYPKLSEAQLAELKAARKQLEKE